jgi:hypothetical protein
VREKEREMKKKRGRNEKNKRGFLRRREIKIVVR